LVEVCETARTIATYNATFERGCLERMAEALPARAEGLRRLAERVVDLLPVVRNQVSPPQFGGSFGLKSVLPALVPELRYDALAIADGATASLELERLLFPERELGAEARAHLREDLLRYCGQDSWGLVKLLECLRHLARSLACFRPPPSRAMTSPRTTCSIAFRARWCTSTTKPSPPSAGSTRRCCPGAAAFST